MRHDGVDEFVVTLCQAFVGFDEIEVVVHQFRQTDCGFGVVGLSRVVGQLWQWLGLSERCLWRTPQRCRPRGHG